MTVAAVAAPLLSGCSLLAPRASTGDLPDRAHSLTEIVAELQAHARDDTYRYPRVRTEDGRTIFQVALWRLDRIRAARAREGIVSNADLVIDYARGRALERSRRYTEALDAYARVEAVGSMLQAPAAEARAAMAGFASLSSSSEVPIETPEQEHRFIEERVRAWRAAVLEYRGTAYEPLAREEQESWEVLRVEWARRHGSPERAIELGRRLIERHSDSKHYARHLIRLGDLYADASRREYVRYRAGMGAFDAQRYERWLDQAFALYELAGDERQPQQRREAARRIEALLGYHRGVREHVP